MSAHLAVIRIVVCAVISFTASLTGAAAQATSPLPEVPQIAWQRSLDDALAIAAAESRPLLIAVNVDGESASDRIVTERYRNARFVAWTKPFVCVVASPSRHNPRDFDSAGKRIPCPRLGDVTCGEHIALEPLVFDRYLGGERISPRHAVIQPDGKKSFDLFLLFDLKDLDAELERCAGLAPPPAEPVALPTVLDRKSGKNRLKQWRVLAAARTARSRDVFERIVRDTKSEGWMQEALDAVAEVGDAGSIGVLQALIDRDPLPSPGLLEQVGGTAQSLKVGASIATMVRGRLAGLGKFPGWPSFGEDRALLSLLARFGAATTSVRSFLLAHQALGAEADREAAGRALAPHVSTEDVSRIAAAIEAEGGPCDFPGLMMFAVDVGRALPSAEKPSEMPLPTAELERELEASDTAVAADPKDPLLQQRFGRANLALARRYVEEGGGNPLLLFEDARTWLARAAAERRNDVKLAFDRARAAYYLSRFEEQERIALDAFGEFPQRDAIDARALVLVDPRTLGDGDVRRAVTLLFAEDKLESLRWIGDASMRLLATRSSGDAALEVTGILRGARALALVAVSPSSTEADWLSLASFMSVIGFEREAACAWELGAGRIPESNALREGLNRALWAAGRLDLAPAKAEFIAARNPNSGVSAWHAAYAWILFAEESRKEQRFEIALEAYARAVRHFEASIVLRPDFARDAGHYAAMAELGSGFAELSRGRRAEALESLARALKRSNTILDVRDGLDRDVPDFVDALLEWRDGKKSPLDGLVVMEKLLAVDPRGARVVLMISDAELREALRADGRAPVTGQAEDGTPLRLPSAEGDQYMSNSIAIARSAVGIEETEATRTQLAQSLAVHAERWLAREATAEALPLLDEAARILAVEPPSAGATLGALNETAAELRALLGPARPVFRQGR